MSGDSVQRVRIYLNERDAQEGRALYLLVLERLLREGGTGATALRGMAGFGPGMRMRATLGSVADTQPVVIEWVDRVDRIAKVMPALDDLLGEALVTIEDLHAYRARLRAGGPFGSQTVGETALRDLMTVTRSAGLRESVRELLLQSQPALPVLDAERRVVALLASDDLIRRGSLPLPLPVIRALRSEEQADVLRVLPDLPLEAVIGDEPRTCYVQSSVPQAVATLLEWGLESLPVVDRDGAFVGLFGVEQALQCAVESRPATDAAVRDAEAPPPVRLLMQTSIPTVEATAHVAASLKRLLALPSRPLVILEEGRPVGLLNPVLILERLEPPLRYAWLQALRNPGVAAELPEPEPPLTLTDLAARPPTISDMLPQNDAIRIALEGGHDWLVVVNDEGLFAGILGRQALLRSLAQSSG